MKETKLRNVIFPIWFLWFFPPILLIALLGNFIIDSIVIVASFIALKVSAITGFTIKELYKKTIVKVWGFGFLADIIGTIPLLIGFAFGLRPFQVPSEVEVAVMMNPLSNFWAFLIVFSCMVLASIFIYLFNYHITYKAIVEDKIVRAKLALILAVVTTPWTFLIPSEWFYSGF
ncbi:hypothetical protein [Heliorestis convoluta]|uniref:Putative membrane protein n=1 Tax=Heliorestis convoluta TaxID=356322 RepID=A0A5Q2MYI0_9FIRM|nr:hypothetical protein [Heliorestis convoluta]QGG46453.1 putative membrane protein [Heliorestis convoluta]